MDTGFHVPSPICVGMEKPQETRCLSKFLRFFFYFEVVSLGLLPPGYNFAIFYVKGGGGPWASLL